MAEILTFGETGVRSRNFSNLLIIVCIMVGLVLIGDNAKSFFQRKTSEL